MCEENIENLVKLGSLSIEAYIEKDGKGFHFRFCQEVTENLPISENQMSYLMLEQVEEYLQSVTEQIEPDFYADKTLQ